MTQKHTAGPWKLRGEYTVVDSQDQVIAKTIDSKLMEHRANAVLIASAPDLLAERDRLRDINVELVEFAKLVAEHFANTRLPLGIAARAALAKATGDQS